MKARKIAGIRLVNYIQDNINWKDHKDIVLDYWIAHKCRDFGYYPKQFDSMFIVDELPIKAQQHYEKWFNSYDFQNESDKSWIEFVNGTLNIFYHTSNPTEMPENTWYIDLMQSEVKAREIAETQIYSGNPNINNFWKIDTNSKPEEVGGRRNGYIFTNELIDINPSLSRGYFWAIAFQCPETVKLFFQDGKERKSRCISWAANCRHITLLKVLNDGRFKVEQVFVPGKAWRKDRYVPQSKIPNIILSGRALCKYFDSNFYDMFGVWDKVDAEIKQNNEASNQRKNAINAFNDEQVKISNVLEMPVDDFIVNGNVSDKKRARNKKIRQAIREKNKLREREIKKKIREIKKDENKQYKRERDKFNAFRK
jgi:hypothetical protein